MVTQKKPKSSKFLSVPTKPIPVDRDRSIAGLLEKMEGVGYGAKQLAESHRIWLDMLGDNCTIYLAMSNDLIPAGMRRLISYVIKNRFVDVIVVSGTTLYHDLHETLGRYHYQAHQSMSDDDLETSNVIRIGDTLASVEEYREADEWLGGFAQQLEQNRSYGGREFLHLLGRELAEIATEDGILTSAFKARVPVYCPDFATSEMIVGIAQSRFDKKNQVSFDLTQDVLEMMQIANRSRTTGVIALGNAGINRYIRLTETTVNIMRAAPRGHKYAVTIATDAPQMSGRPNSQSDNPILFGKLARGGVTANVQCDATIALPIVITALSQTAAKYMKGRKRPNFGLAGKDLQIEVS